METTYNQKLANGSHFSGIYIRCSYGELLEKFGDDLQLSQIKTGRVYDNYTDDKIKHQWILTSGPAGDQIITIYDYKEDKKILRDTIIDWHVGCKNLTQETVYKVLRVDFEFNPTQLDSE